ncbi:uncharacterized protein [Haliotis cracherodii]|uniref:uncharacterized protein n=1 Tax=Haliotis cracherodii TaxID=6455 RepID=UPI0039E9A9A1
MIAKVLFAVGVMASLACGQNVTSSPYACTTANGTAPDITDNDCTRYWSCLDFNITLLTCPDGEAYSWFNGTCVNESRVPCEAQNEAFNQTLANYTQAGRQKRAATYGLPQFLAPSSGNATSNSSNTSEVQIGKLEPITVTLGRETCSHIGNNIRAAERVVNNALHLFTHCVFDRCNIEPLQFVCP